MLSYKYMLFVASDLVNNGSRCEQGRRLEGLATTEDWLLML